MQQKWTVFATGGSGIPERVAGGDPEYTALNTFKKRVNVLVDPSNVEDCHRMKAGKVESKKVIIKLSRGKDVSNSEI